VTTAFYDSDRQEHGIAEVNVDGSFSREIYRTSGLVDWPIRVAPGIYLFVKSEINPSGGRNKFTNRDFFIINVNSGEVRQKTSYHFYYLWRPTLVDGQDLIFSGTGFFPNWVLGGRVAKFQSEYRKTFGENYVFRLTSFLSTSVIFDDSNLLKPLFTIDGITEAASSDAAGTIIGFRSTQFVDRQRRVRAMDHNLQSNASRVIGDLNRCASGQVFISENGRYSVLPTFCMLGHIEFTIIDANGSTKDLKINI
jgi:hypothetical protein